MYLVHVSNAAFRMSIENYNTIEIECWKHKTDTKNVWAMIKHSKAKKLVTNLYILERELNF